MCGHLCTHYGRPKEMINVVTQIEKPFTKPYTAFEVTTILEKDSVPVGELKHENSTKYY